MAKLPDVPFKTIDRFPLYQFHENGQVVSLVKKNPIIMSPIRMGKYIGLQLKNEHGLIIKEYVHRLIAEAFHGPAPLGMVCRHLDGDSANNTPSNLKWGTYSQNNLDRREHGTSPDGARNPNARLTAEKVALMREIRKSTGPSYAAIGRMFDVSTMTAFRAVTEQSWRQS